MKWVFDCLSLYVVVIIFWTGMLTVFCERLNWRTLALLISQFSGVCVCVCGCVFVLVRASVLKLLFILITMFAIIIVIVITILLLFYFIFIFYTREWIASFFITHYYSFIYRGMVHINLDRINYGVQTDLLPVSTGFCPLNWSTTWILYYWALNCFWILAHLSADSVVCMG